MRSERYYCEECNEVVRPNEEMLVHASMTGHNWYTPKDLADRGFYGWEDRVNSNDLENRSSHNINKANLGGEDD